MDFYETCFDWLDSNWLYSTRLNSTLLYSTLLYSTLTLKCHNFWTPWRIFKLEKSKLLKILPGFQLDTTRLDSAQLNLTLFYSIYSTLTWKCHNFWTPWRIFKLQKSKLLKILPGIQILSQTVTTWSPLKSVRLLSNCSNFYFIDRSFW